MSNPINPTSNQLNRSKLSSDISALLSLPAPTLRSLTTDDLSPAPPSVSTSSTPTPASALLSTFSPSSTSTNHDTSVNLSAAYLREMREIRHSGLEGKLERLGKGIEGVRGGAEGVQEALWGVAL